MELLVRTCPLLAEGAAELEPDWVSEMKAPGALMLKFTD